MITLGSLSDGKRNSILKPARTRIILYDAKIRGHFGDEPI